MRRRVMPVRDGNAPSVRRVLSAAETLAVFSIWGRDELLGLRNVSSGRCARTPPRSSTITGTCAARQCFRWYYQYFVMPFDCHYYPSPGLVVPVGWIISGLINSIIGYLVKAESRSSRDVQSSRALLGEAAEKERNSARHNRQNVKYVCEIRS